MNGKKSKLLRKFSRVTQRPIKNLKAFYTALSSAKREEFTIEIRKALATIEKLNVGSNNR